MKITVKVRKEGAADTLAAPTNFPDENLEQALRTQGASLTPMHPGTQDSDLASWFETDVDDDKVDEVLRVLRSSAAIEAAYVKPAEEPP